MSVNFARLNHILIPATKAGRDRFRNGRLARIARPALWLYERLSDEGRAVAVAASLALALGLDVLRMSSYFVGLPVVALFAAALHASRAFAIDDVDLEVIAPRRVALGEPTTFDVVLTNRGELPALSLRVRGPFLPWDGRFVGELPRLAVLAPGAEARLELRAKFAARGEHHLDPFQVASVGPLGIAMGPARATSGVRFLVVPRVAEVTRSAAPLGRRYQPGGERLASRSGESAELFGVRPYRPGDRVRDLHARSWARTGQPIVREYREEYFRRVAVVVLPFTDDERTLDALLSVAAGLLAQSGDDDALADLFVVAERVHELTLGRHVGFLEQALDVLACVEPSAPRDVEAVVGALGDRLERLSEVVIVAPVDDGGAVARAVEARGALATTVVVARRGRVAVPSRPRAVVVDVEAVEARSPVTC